MDSISNILFDEFEQLKSDVIFRHENAGQVATGKTRREFENRFSTQRRAELLGARYSGVLESGRKPGGVPRNFIELLRRWANAKRITFSNEKDFLLWANAVKWKIIREGTELYRSDRTEDIFTTPLSDMTGRLISRIEKTVDQEIKNQIFKK